MDLFGVIYGAELLVGFVFRKSVQSIGLPIWSADESYLSRLRRWRTDRQGQTDESRAPRRS